MKKFLIPVLFLCTFTPSFSQISGEVHRLGFDFGYLGYIKNNEYFNHIADGYTWLGHRFTPVLDYRTGNGISLAGGIFLHQYWGTGRVEALPYFRFTYYRNGSRFILGNLENSGRHGLIEPLMGVENSFDTRSVEQGLQYLLEKKHFRCDVWLDWERFIDKGDSHNEVIFNGMTAEFRLLRSGRTEVAASLQNTLYHKGGQINISSGGERQVYTMWHLAPGVDLQYSASKDITLSGKLHFIYFASDASVLELPFDEGYAWYSNAGIRYGGWRLHAGHWYGYHFISPHGDDMYQCVSQITDTGEIPIHDGYTDPVRSLLTAGLSYDKELAKGLKFKLDFQAYYQNYYSNPTPEIPGNTVKDHLDYSVGLQLQYSGVEKLFAWY